MQKFLEMIKKDKKVFTAVVCIFVAIIFACIAGIAYLISELISEDVTDEVIYSCDFNSGTDEFTEEAWVQENTLFQYCGTEGIDGSGCVMVSNTLENDARYAVTLQVEEDAYYRVSGWVKTENIPAIDGAAGANISVLNNFQTYDYIYGTQNWTHLEVYGKTADGQDEITVALRVGFYSGDNTGTAWFDNIEVERIAELPEGVSAVSFEDVLTNSGSSSSSTVEEVVLDEDFYYDMTKAVLILTLVTFLAFCIAYRFARAYDGFKRVKPLDPPAAGPISITKGLIAVFAIGVIIRIALALSPVQCSVDVNIFKYWGNMSVSGGFTNTYITLADSIDYPPLYVYVLYAASGIKNIFKFLGEYQNNVYSLLIKLTPIVADCAIAAFIYKICDKRMRNEWILIAVSAWLLNPVVIIDSAAWGQVDSVLALFVLLAVYFAENKKYLASGIMLGLGMMLKPQAIIVFPIVFYVLVKAFIQSKEKIARRFIPALKTLGGFASGAVVPCLPFMFKMGFVEIELFGKAMNVPWIVSLFAGTANHYAYASVNALNHWFIIGKNWVPDNEKFAFLSIFTWGMIAIVVICVIIWVLYQLNKKQPFMPYMLAAALYMGVSMFSSRMHERYFFTAVAFAAVAMVLSNNKIIMWLYTALSAFGFLTIAEVLLDLEVGAALKDANAGHEIYSKYLWVSQTDYRMFIAYGMVVISLLLFVFSALFVFLGKKMATEKLDIWKLKEKTDSKEAADNE